MEDTGCMSAALLGLDILVVIFDLIAILSGRAGFEHYITLVCAIIAGVCAILYHRENHR